jgi:hypothetical protein
VSTDEKLDLARGWRSAMKLREEETDRLAELNDDEFAAAMSALPAPSQVPPLETLVAGNQAAREPSGELHGAVPAVDAPVEQRGPSPFLWLLAAAFLLTLGIGIAKRDAIVAFFKPAPEHEQPSPIPTAPPPPTPPTPIERAELVRLDADKACDDAAWVNCMALLNQAEKLDPGGESTPRVQHLRERISLGLLVDAGDKKKGKPH